MGPQFTSVTKLTERARAIFDAGVKAADPAECVRRAMKGRKFEGPVTVVGAGKAVGPMAQAVEELVPEAGGIVVTKYGHAVELQNILMREAGHPVPDEAGERATGEVLAALGRYPTICLLSGGGSSLLTAPVEGVSLADKQAVTDLLLMAGAPIQELNCVRKHLSTVKGGRLAQRVDAPILSLILSDVIGDPLDVIASGPTAPDPSTLEDARAILRDRDLWAKTPASVRQALEFGEETPKPGDPAFERVENRVIGDNRLALEAAALHAKMIGYPAKILTTEMQGDAREVVKKLLRHASKRGCYLAGGETTVKVTGKGKGGRCQELALAAALELEGTRGTVLLAAGTDGTDGPTDAAGAVVDGNTATEDAVKFLEDNDSYGFFAKHGGHVITGPTRTNVMDIVVILKSR